MIGYARQSDYLAAGIAAAFGPAALYTFEKFAPSQVGKGGFAKAMRLTSFIGLAGGFLYFYQRSSRRCSLLLPSRRHDGPRGDCMGGSDGAKF